MVRTAALHGGTPVDGLNRVGVRAIETLLGDRSNDPRSTIATTSFDIPFSLHEDLAGNLPHFLLVTLGLLSLPFLRASNARTLRAYGAAVVLGAVLYSAILMWQPWASRLHTPLFMLSAPLIAAVLAGRRHGHERILPIVAAVLFAYSLPFVTLNATRPLAALVTDGMPSTDERLRSYFVNRRELDGDYRAAARIILEEEVETVGLCMGYDDYEYPLWVLVGREATRGSPTFRHVGVHDASRMKEEGGFPAPMLVVSTKRLDADPVSGVGRQAVDPCLEGAYEIIYDSATLSVLRRM
jgi:hypothetical protein